MPRGLASIVVAGLLLSGCGTQTATTTAATASTRQSLLTITDAPPPPGVNVPGAHWIRIRGAGGVAENEQLAAVFRPSGQGPFPLVVELHGDAGLKDVDVKWAARLAAAGFVSVAGCWQYSAAPSAGPPNTMQWYELNITLVACPKLVVGSVDAIAGLIGAGQRQPGVRTDGIGLYGMSAGGEMALQIVAARKDIRAAALDSPGVVGAPSPSSINTPVLILAGTADANVPFADQKHYVEALQQAGKDVAWHYYEGGRHTLILDPSNNADAASRIIDFLAHHLNT